MFSHSNFVIGKQSNVNYLLLISIVIVYAFSNIKGLSIAAQLLMVLIMLLNLVKFGRIKVTVHLLWMTVFITWGYFVSLFAYDSIASTSEAINLTLKLFFYTALISLIDSDSKFNWILRAIVIAGLILIVRVIIMTPFDVWGTDRLGANLGLNPNTIGIALTYSSIASVYIAKKSNKTIYYLFLIPFIVISLMTGSRKAFLALLGGVSLFLFISIRRVKNKSLVSIIIVFFIVLLYELSMNTSFLHEVLGQRLAGANIFSNSQVDSSTRDRLRLYNEGWLLFQSNPVLGYGLDNFRRVSFFGGYSHNNFIEVLTSTGIIGFFVYYSLPIIMLINSIKNRKKNIGYALIATFLTIIILLDLANVSYRQIITQVVIAILVAKFVLLKLEYRKNVIKEEMRYRFF
ncbi:O-antigen ligase family protein [Pseudalkalibacillus hwajinpoensis]|uniref:O-antigen ligase family protein n=1 Tax=Guptibacillus hwajinpoensis TaxID=208199 RepID=A0A4U1MJI6_9BACL|nr:O-antigen ligase family protein [Pseudalkalibacillus hwajinpoensis]TKD70735.1 O-antigen ligase family protein [Pseudalkalibacillus hwajinpoensis]